MAMLAEPKHKVKWTLNPRGNDWAKDESNYGQKMLRKMGWEKGKGLGKNEDGNTDHIKVTYKNDKKGLGIVGYDDNWIAHQDDFNTVLSSLNEQFHLPTLSTESNESKPESLEKKSRSSRSRVHYHKFIQGKDITRYSSKDMAAIFGNKKKESERSASENEELLQEDNKECNTSSVMITYNSGQSIQEYFNQKMAALQNSGKKPKDCKSNYINVPIGEDNVSSNHFTQPEPESIINLDPIKENQQTSLARKRKKHKKQKKKKRLKINVQSESDSDKINSFNEKDISASESNILKREQCANHHICVEKFSCKQSIISENHTSNLLKSVDQGKHQSVETEHSDKHKLNFIAKRKIDDMNDQFSNNDNVVELYSAKKRNRKRKLDTTQNPLEIQKYKDSSLLDNTSENIHEMNNVTTRDTKISDREIILSNHVNSSNEIKEDNFLVKVKKQKKDKRNKNLNESADSSLSVCNTKKSIRCNALQQMKLYFDVFPNRQTLPVLKKYEALCENFNDTGLASSNLLLVPGYGNELIFKDKTIL